MNSNNNKSKYQYKQPMEMTKAASVPGLENMSKRSKEPDPDALAQVKLNTKMNGYFVLTKDFKHRLKTIPSGTCGRVGYSRYQHHVVVARFAAPFDSLEAVLDPDEYLSFGM